MHGHSPGRRGTRRERPEQRWDRTGGARPHCRDQEGQRLGEELHQSGTASVTSRDASPGGGVPTDKGSPGVRAEREGVGPQLASSKPQEEPQPAARVREGVGREAVRAGGAQQSQRTGRLVKSWLDGHRSDLKVSQRPREHCEGPGLAWA